MIESIAVSHSPYMLGSYSVDTTLSAQELDGSQRALTLTEIRAVIGRNGTLSLTHTLEDGSRSSQRARYAYADDTILLAAADCPQSLQCEPRDVAVECDVSELIGLSIWHYVWLHGSARCSQPTGSAVERGAWRSAVEVLRHAFPDLARAEELAFANFGIVHIAIRTRVGLALSLTSTAERSLVATRDGC